MPDFIGVAGRAQVDITSAAGTAPDDRSAHDMAACRSPQAVQGALDALGLDGAVAEVEWFVARRPVALVQFDDRPPLVLKWPHHEPMMSSDNEVVLLRLLASRQLPKFTLASIPRLVASDADSGLVAIEGQASCVPLRATSTRCPALPAVLLTQLAAVLAGLHASPVEDLRPLDPDRCLWPPLSPMREITPSELIRGFGVDFPTYVAALQRVDAQVRTVIGRWRHRALIHFDVSDENVLVMPSDSGPRIWLVDWELAGFGDPLYDLGRVIGGMFANWFRRPEAGAEAWGEGWAIARRNATLFLFAYRQLSGLSDEEVLQVLRFAGLFQFMNAYGRLERLGSLGRFGHLSLLLGQRLLERPEAVLASLGSG